MKQPLLKGLLESAFSRPSGSSSGVKRAGDVSGCVVSGGVDGCKAEARAGGSDVHHYLHPHSHPLV